MRTGLLALVGFLWAWEPAASEPLYYAVLNNDAAGIWSLTQDPGAADRALSTGDLPLVLAVNRGWYDATAVLLDRGASPNQRDKGVPVVLLAARKGRVDLVRLLLDKKADPQGTDGQGESLWHVAAAQTDGKLALFLSGLSLDVNRRDGKDQTPLHVACQAGILGNAKLLLQKGADPTLPDSEGRTPKDMAPRTPEWVALWK